MAFQVKLWGVRGSIPSPYTPEYHTHKNEKILAAFCESEFFSDKNIHGFLASQDRHFLNGYGGNTSCAEVRAGKQSIIIDAGSGIRKLGDSLLSEQSGQGLSEFHILFTHFHWDHINGLPFFTPMFIPGNKIHMYAVQDDLEEVVRRKFTKPNFPVPFKDIQAEVIFHKLEPRKEFELSEFKITPYKLDHPDPCWGYKFEKSGKAFSYCVDTECTRMSRKAMGEDLALYQNIDFMVFDSQYTLPELVEKVDWGHATATVGIDIATREGIKEVAFVHHEPHATDEGIREAEDEARRYYEYLKAASKKNGYDFSELEFCFAHEGQVIEI